MCVSHLSSAPGQQLLTQREGRMVVSGASFDTAVTVTCAVGLVIVLRRLHALQKQVETLNDLVQGHETSVQWLTQRLEPPLRVCLPTSVPLQAVGLTSLVPLPQAAEDAAASHKGLPLPPAVSRQWY